MIKEESKKAENFKSVVSMFETISPLLQNLYERIELADKLADSVERILNEKKRKQLWVFGYWLAVRDLRKALKKYREGSNDSDDDNGGGQL